MSDQTPAHKPQRKLLKVYALYRESKRNDDWLMQHGGELYSTLARAMEQCDVPKTKWAKLGRLRQWTSPNMDLIWERKVIW